MLKWIFDYTINVVHDCGYWVASVTCVISTLCYAVTKAQKFLQIVYFVILAYILLMGIGSVAK